MELYLEKGSHLRISANAKNVANTIKFSGDLANENNYLALKRKLSENNLFGLSEKDFLTSLNQNKEKLLFFLKNNNISNKFYEEEIELIKYDYAIEKLLYPQFHRRITGNKNFIVDPDYYIFLNDLNFGDTLAYKNSQKGTYPALVQLYFEKIARDNIKQYNDDELYAYVAEVDKAFEDGSVKDKLLLIKLMGGMKLNDNMDDIYHLYKKAFQNDEYLKMATQEYNQLKRLKPGLPAPNFNLENYLGGHTQLKDLKGKNIYIDIWATWCRPCIAEFPALKDIAKKFPDIQFVSISIDRKGHFEKWKNMVEKENLPGIQLIAYQENKNFKNNYAIRTIPRYVLIDKNRTIVSASAFHPSNPKLEELLRSLE